MAENPLDVLDHFAGAYQQRVGDFGETRSMPVSGLARATAEIHSFVAPFLEGIELFFAQLFEFADFAAGFQQRVPVVKRAPGIEQQTLPAFELLGERLPQFQVAVDHVVEQAQHQLFRRSRQALAAARRREQAFAQRGHRGAVG